MMLLRPSPFEGIPRRDYGAILVDAPQPYVQYDKTRTAVKARGRTDIYYETMTIEDIKAVPVASLAARDCVLFQWVTWRSLLLMLEVTAAWGFTYKTCAFDWMKVTKKGEPAMGMGKWARLNTEACLLATRGHPKRLHGDVRQAILEPRREHSRKPDCVYGRIERLVAPGLISNCLPASGVRVGTLGATNYCPNRKETGHGILFCLELI